MFGALSRLPVKASDFASACLTADVPREYLRLVLVRVAATTMDGSVVDARCRVVALLLDSRHTVARMCEAVRNAIRASRASAHETDALIASTLLFTRVSGTIIAINPSAALTSSVYQESTMANGQLRGSLHITGALRAYRRHATIQSRVCIREAASVLRAQERSMASGNELVDRYVTGLRRLGVAKPTRIVPDDCACRNDDSCACFMARAIWRAGRSWMIVYALMPPVLAVDIVAPSPPLRLRLTTTTAAATSSTSLSWLDKLLEVTASESEDVANPLDALEPMRWRSLDEEELRFALRPLTLRASARQLLAGIDDDVTRTTSDDDDDDDDDDDGATDALSLAEAVVVWAFTALPDDMFVSHLVSLAKHVNIYHKSALEHVLATTTRRRELALRALVAASSAPPAVDMFAALHRASTGAAALEYLMPLFARHATSGGGAWHPLAPNTCKSTGYTLIVSYALLACCAAYAATPRAVNTWHVCYRYCDRLAEGLARSVQHV